MPRLFVAIPIPAEVAAGVGGVMDRARVTLGDDGARVRWVQTEGLHITLRFLGPTRADLVEVAADAVRGGVVGARIDPFQVSLGGSGSFPAPDRPRALWLGITHGADLIGSLAAAVDEALVTAGWDLERRAFRPHMTIARTDGVRAGPAAAQALAAAVEGFAATFPAERVVLYRSHLGRGPARYEALAEAPLG